MDILERMPLPIWLTPKQELFVAEMLKNNDPVESVRLAYPSTEGKNLRRMASYLLRTRAVRASIALRRGEAEAFDKAFLIEQLWDVIEKSRNDMARVRAIELAAEITGIVQPTSKKKGKFTPVDEHKVPQVSKDLAKRIEKLNAAPSHHPNFT